MPTLSLGLFAVGHERDDTRTPHRQDEVDVVVGGAAVLEVAGKGTPVAAGTVAYVPALVPHRVEIREDLRVFVVFVPPLTDQTPARSRRVGRGARRQSLSGSCPQFISE